MSDGTFYIVTLGEDEPELIGPFPDGTAAVDFAAENLGLESWWVTDAAAATDPESSAFQTEDLT